jgi:hypothetical protein
MAWRMGSVAALSEFVTEVVANAGVVGRRSSSRIRTRGF